MLHRIVVMGLAGPFSLGVGPDMGAQKPGPGILGQAAPQLEVRNWRGLPKDVKSVDVADHRGKVVYLYFFQSACPACSSHGFPLLERMAKHYQGKDDVVFLAVQTVFEGLRVNTVENGHKLAVGKFGLDIPLGYDAAAKEHQRSRVMDLYRTAGTPWTVLIDRRGIVRFNGFGMDLEPAAAIRKIDELRAEKILVGTRLAHLAGVECIGEPLRFADHDFTLLRWFVDSVASRDSLRSLDALQQRAATTERFAVLAIYADESPEPSRDASRDHSRDAIWARARKMRYSGRVAIDRHLAWLKQLRQLGGPGSGREIAVLVDRQGIVRWVHAGPRLHPRPPRSGRKDPHPEATAGFAQLERVLAAPQTKQRK